MHNSYWIAILFFILPLCLEAKINDMPVPKPIHVADDAELVRRLRSAEWLKACDVVVDKLVLITVPYWGFDCESHKGNLIVHQAVAKDLEEIFQILHKNKFPIQKIRMRGEPHSETDPLIRDNITATYNCRMKRGKKELSNHAYGVAIDINPLMNPYIKGDTIIPESACKYVDRKPFLKGMIKNNMLIYQLFKERGWEWGGDWMQLKDYQHFEKPSVIK